MINNILNKNEMKKLISDCFLKKFKQFEEKIKGKKIELLNKDFNNVYEENNNENKNKISSNLTKNNNNDTNEDDLPPAEDALKYPDKSQVEEKTPKTNLEKSSALKSFSENKIFVPNGWGIMYNLRNNNRYEGQFKNGIRYGQGKMIFSNGYTLKGNFNDKAVNGGVEITYPNDKKGEKIKLVLFNISISDIDNFDIQSFVNKYDN